MKTVIIWDQCGEAEIAFLVVNGDRRHLDGVYINVEGDEKKQDELLDLVMDEGSQRKMLEDFPTAAVCEGAFVIVAGFFP